MNYVKLKEEEYKNLYSFMKPLWYETYENIISHEQIDFLLDKYFKVENIYKYVLEGYQYYSIFDNLFLGYVVYVIKSDYLYLDKLYLLEDARGKEIPKEVFKHLQSFGYDIRLNVNQKNNRAVKCYLKNGFVVENETVIHVADGMINYDYEMVLKVKK